MSEITVNELIEKRRKLERDIHDLIKAFQSDTGVSVDDINLSVANTNSDDRLSRTVFYYKVDVSVSI